MTENWQIIFYSICGEHAKTKYIGSEVFSWHIDEIKEFICGYIDGDGYFSEKVNNFTIRTASENIAMQVQKLLSMLNSWASIFKCENSENEIVKYINTTNKDTFSITVPNFLSNRILTSSCIKSKNFENITDVDRTSHWQYENYDIVKIRKIAKKEFKGHVFNFSVKDNENYIANNIVVHNCKHVKENKARTFNGKKVYEENHGVKFIELSFVVDPACEQCNIQEIFDIEDLKEKVANISEGLRKVASKFAGKVEVDKLNQAEKLMQEVAKAMLDQKDQLQLEYVSDLVEALSKLQETKDELVDMGYSQLPSAGSTETETTTPETTSPNSPVPPTTGMEEKGQNMEQQNIESTEPTSQAPAGGVGTVTMPNGFASSVNKRIIIANIFEHNVRQSLINKWNKE